MHKKTSEVRTRFLRNAFEFAETITRGQEEVEGFSFYSQRGMLEGNSLKIWYHPNPESGRQLVLDIWWQNIEQCRYEIFEEEKEWQKRLRVIICHRKKLEANAAESKAVSEERKKRRLREFQEEVGKMKKS